MVCASRSSLSSLGHQVTLSLGHFCSAHPADRARVRKRLASPLSRVFTTKVDSRYDDLPEIRYHFPGQYLSRAEQAVGDWILYYEPRRVSDADAGARGRQSYFAVARVTGIVPDSSVPGHYYALMEHYIEFPTPVPYRIGSSFPERALVRDDGNVKRGLMRSAVRPIDPEDYKTIVSLGFSDSRELTPSDLTCESAADRRRMVESLVVRPFRDHAFSRVIHQAYNEQCAFTGLRIINGGGLSEVEAAHIQAVEDGGPDSPRNGLALSRTIHWAFDHHMLSLTDDGRILRSSNLPQNLAAILNSDGRARLPSNAALRPHRRFLEYHRDVVFEKRH